MKHSAAICRWRSRKDDGNLAARYPHSLKHGYDAPEPAALLREILNRQPDHSVVLVQVGYFSNLASLLDTTNDKTSPLSGRELVSLKVKYLSVMAGAFEDQRRQSPSPARIQCHQGFARDENRHQRLAHADRLERV